MARPPRSRGSSPPNYASSTSTSFLGFTFICGTTRAGNFRVLLKTISKRRRNKLRAQARTQAAPAPAGTGRGEVAIASSRRRA